MGRITEAITKRIDVFQLARMFSGLGPLKDLVAYGSGPDVQGWPGFVWYCGRCKAPGGAATKDEARRQAEQHAATHPGVRAVCGEG